MSRYVPKTHFRFITDPTVRFYGRPRGVPACGGRIGASITSNVDAVTCRRCWRSGPYCQAAAAAAHIRNHRPPCWHCGTSRRTESANYRGYQGLCVRCYRRWRDSGYPAGGPSAPRGRTGGSPAARWEDYQFLRETGLSPAEAALRLGVVRRTALRYEQRLRQQPTPEPQTARRAA